MRHSFSIWYPFSTKQISLRNGYFEVLLQYLNRMIDFFWLQRLVEGGSLLAIYSLYCFVECREQSETGCLEESHNPSNPRRVRLVCDQREMIRAKRAFLATFNAPLQTAHRWCDNPNYDSSHCKQYESQLTGDFIRTCNTRSVCTVNQYYTELSDCQSAVFDPQLVRRTYIHVEFDCLPSKLLHYFKNLSKHLLPLFSATINVPLLNIRKKKLIRMYKFDNPIYFHGFCNIILQEMIQMTPTNRFLLHMSTL